MFCNLRASYHLHRMESRCIAITFQLDHILDMRMEWRRVQIMSKTIWHSSLENSFDLSLGHYFVGMRKIQNGCQSSFSECWLKEKVDFLWQKKTRYCIHKLICPLLWISEHTDSILYAESWKGNFILFELYFKWFSRRCCCISTTLTYWI